MRDELSRLPPFNYYLLFAITCHLNLLNQYSDISNMDYNNLCIYFQPCLRMDAYCFEHLVKRWKHCWQGCWTEKEYLEKEYRHEQAVRALVRADSSDKAPTPAAAEETDGEDVEVAVERPAHSHLGTDSRRLSLGLPPSPRLELSEGPGVA
jgi:hypothetical protein